MKKAILTLAVLCGISFGASAQSVDTPKMERVILGDEKMGFYKYTYDGNKWGLVDTNDVILEEPIYEYIGWFVDGCAVVKKDGKYGFIDTTGTIVIPVQYLWASDFVEGKGFAYVRPYDDPGHPLYINSKGEVVGVAYGDGCDIQDIQEIYNQ